VETAREARRLARQRHAFLQYKIEATARRTARLKATAVRLRPTTGPFRRGLGALLGSRGWDAVTRGVKRLQARRAVESEADEPEARRELERRRRVLDRAARRVGAYETGTSQLRLALGRAIRRARPSDDAGKVSAPMQRIGIPGSIPPTIAFCIAAPDSETARRGGDYHFAGSLAAALCRRGRPAVVETATESRNGGGGSAVRIVLRGRHAIPPRAGCANLLWVISHPDRVTTAELVDYDHVLVASAMHARTLAGKTGVPVDVLPQFADRPFVGAAGARRECHDLLFVGNWRGVYRRIVWDAHCLGRRPALVGEGWKYLAPAETIASHAPYPELPDLYRSAQILLVDHWDDMRERGFVSNRVFDALACGAFVIADDVAGLSDLLPGGLETYSSLTELDYLLTRYLASPEERRRIAVRGRDLVLASHTVEHRVDRLLEIVERVSGPIDDTGTTTP
jgi:hypothetical protein